MKLLYCAAEAYPFVKSGGLADVAYALPQALSKKIETTLMLPWYHFMKLTDKPQKVAQEVLFFAGKSYPVSYWKCNLDKVEVVLVKAAPLYESQKLYGEENDDLRFALFGRAIVLYAKRESFDILHLNDWHTALAALFAKEQGIAEKVVFTIHNLAFQGLFPYETLQRAGIDKRYFHMEALEFYGQVNFMKAGIAFSDVVTTVSPTYAGEIQTATFGCGLEGFLQKHRKKLYGILNGIDTEVFNPRTDPMIACTMKRKESTFKACNKKAFLSKRIDLPLFIFIGRLTEQKGVDLLIALHEVLVKLPLHFAFLGDGEGTYVAQLQKMAKSSENIRFIHGYSEPLAHQMYAAADFLVMPSRFEPCGLNQMIAMHYGTIPIVHKTGGLADTVHERGEKCGRGILCKSNDMERLRGAIKRALRLYREKKQLEKLNRFNMQCDFSFERSAREYIRLYKL